MSPIDTLIENQQTRAVRSSAIEILSVSRTKNSPLATAPAGSVLVFVAPKGSGFVKGLKAAAGEGGDALVAFTKGLFAQYSKKRPAMTVEEMAKAIVKQPVYAEIAYVGQRLCSGVHVPRGLDAYVVTLPYNGGHIVSKGLALIEHWNENSDAALEAVALKLDPALTEAEKATLKLVPAEQAIKNIGASVDCETTWVAVAVVAVTLVGVTVIGAATIACGLVKDVHLSDAALKKLSPGAAARQLVALRRQALQQGLVR